MSMTKLLFFIPSLVNSAGTERISTSLANFLVKKGYHVDFVVHSLNTNSFFSIDSKVKILSLGLDGDINSHKFRAAWRLRKLIKANSYDVVLNVGVACSYVTLLAMPYLLGCKVISWEHFSIKGLNLKRRIKHYFAASLVDKTIVLTYADSSAYPAILKNKVEVIPNFTSINEYGQSATLSNKVVLACGRLEESVKQFDLLIDSWKIVNATCPDWTLRIIGGGDAKKLYDKIRFLGLSKSIVLAGICDDMSKEYLGCSIVVVSSKYESFSLVIIESMSFGIPIVSFDCPLGPHEILTGCEGAKLVDNGNVNALAGALIEVISDEKLRLQMGKAALIRYKEKYSQNQIIDGWLNLLDMLN